MKIEHRNITLTDSHIFSFFKNITSLNKYFFKCIYWLLLTILCHYLYHFKMPAVDILCASSLVMTNFFCVYVSQFGCKHFSLFFFHCALLPIEIFSVFLYALYKLDSDFTFALNVSHRCSLVQYWLLFVLCVVCLNNQIKWKVYAYCHVLYAYFLHMLTNYVRCRKECVILCRSVLNQLFVTNHC